MGLLTCAQCGCAITAERKKGKYVYYHCTDHHGGCENTYIREERLSDLLGEVMKPIQIPPEVAALVANRIRCSDQDAERRRSQALEHLESRRRGGLAKLDGAYEDFVAHRISNEFWARKSQVWEAELQAIDAEQMRVEAPRPPMIVTAQKILELAKQAESLNKSQDPGEQRRLLKTVLSNCTFNRGTLCPTYSKPFDLLVRGNKTGDWLAILDEFRNFLLRTA